jgi:hypothetical protein
MILEPILDGSKQESHPLMSIEHLHMGPNMKDMEETKLIKQGISKIIKIKYSIYIYIYIYIYVYI